MARKSAYKRYFISYCSIAMIPVIVVIAAVSIIYRVSFNNTSKELYMRSVTQAAVHLDSLIQQLQSSVDQFTVDLSDTTPETDAEIVEYLRITEKSNRLNAAVSFYRLGSTDIYTVEGRIPYQKFEQYYKDEVSFSHSSFFSCLNRTLTFNMIPLYDAKDFHQFSNQIAILIPSYGNSKSSICRGIFIFFITWDTFKSTVADYLGAASDYLYVYAPNLTLLNLYEKESQLQDNRIKMMRSLTSCVTEFLLKTDFYSITHVITEQFGFHIIAGNDLDRIFIDSGRLRQVFLCLSILLSIGLVVLAILLARYSYRPIKKILATVSQNADDAVEPPDNELQYIEKHIENIHTQVQELNATLTLQQPYVLYQVLINLLRGSANLDDLTRLIPTIPHYCFAYVVLSPAGERPASVFREGTEHLCFDTMETWGIFLEDELCYAFLCFTNTQNDCRELQCRELYDQLRVFGIEHPQLSVGSVTDDYTAISQSFLEAFFVLNHLSNEKEKTIVIYQPELKAYYSETEFNTSHELEIFLHSLHSVDYSASYAVLEKLLQKMFLPHGSVLIASYNRYNLFYKTLAQCEPEIVEMYHQSENVSLSLFSDEDSFRKLMYDTIRKNCAAVENKRSNAFQQKKQLILDILQENYDKSDFSLSKLAELSKYSPTYINRFLREETGLSYIQYVSGLRIEKAKALLRNSDEKIKTIVQSCGYLDFASFNRKFKEYVGLTPSEYREQSKM